MAGTKEHYKNLFAKAKERRQTHEYEIQDAYCYGKPNREFLNTRHENLPDRSEVYDITAVLGVRRLVTTTIRLLVPQIQPWASIEYKNEAIKQSLSNRHSKRIAHVNEQFHEHFMSSNFYLAATEALYDDVVAGTMCIQFIDIPGEPLHYLAVPVGQLYFLEDHDEKVDVVFREHEMTARQAASRFGEDDLPDDVKDQLEDNPTAKNTYVECVVPEDGTNVYSVYLKNDWQLVGKQQESPMNPFVVSRWEKTLGHVWGDSPVRQALPSVRTANQIKRDALTYNAFAAFGAWWTEDEDINTKQLGTQMVPGAVLAVPGGLNPIEFPGQPLLNEASLRQEQEEIKNLLFDNRLPSEDALKYMTAEGVISMREEFFEQVGEPANRLSREFLEPVAMQAARRLIARGDIDFITPDEVRAMGARHWTDVFKVTVDAALQTTLRRQRAVQTIEAVTRTSQLVGPQLVNAHVNTDKLTRKLLVQMGVDPNDMRSEAEAEEYLEAIQQSQAQNALQSLLTAGGQRVDAIQQSQEAEAGAQAIQQNAPVA